MNWSVEVDDHSGIITVSLSGQWEGATVFQALESLWAEQLRTGILLSFWDNRGVVGGGVATGQMRDLANLHLRSRPHIPNSKAAVVVTRDLEFGMARMMEAFIAEGPVDMQIFRDVQEAVEWLREEV